MNKLVNPAEFEKPQKPRRDLNRFRTVIDVAMTGGTEFRIYYDGFQRTLMMLRIIQNNILERGH
jgi:hypothetical protein